MTIILGYVEHDRGQLNNLSLEMLTFARRLAVGQSLPLHAVLVGEAARPLVERLAAYGVTTVHLAQHPQLNDYAPEAWAHSLAERIEALTPQAVIAAASDQGSEVMAHTAARLDLPLAANCIEVQGGDVYLVTRQRWGGSLLEEARLHGAVKLLTLAGHVVEAEEAPAAANIEVQEYTPALEEKDSRVRAAGRVEAAAGKVSLTDAKVVVTGGRGVGSADGFKLLEELAGLLGGAVGCSRAVTSLGWRPHSDQVGQTGARVAPEIYIACGVSGAIQHMVGCKGAKHILAINIDPEAPIVSHADYAIFGDLLQVVPALSAEIKKTR